jgi:hypothetical protein
MKLVTAAVSGTLGFFEKKRKYFKKVRKPSIHAGLPGVARAPAALPARAFRVTLATY